MVSAVREVGNWFAEANHCGHMNRLRPTHVDDSLGFSRGVMLVRAVLRGKHRPTKQPRPLSSKDRHRGTLSSHNCVLEHMYITNCQRIDHGISEIRLAGGPRTYKAGGRLRQAHRTPSESLTLETWSQISSERNSRQLDPSCAKLTLIINPFSLKPSFDCTSSYTRVSLTEVSFVYSKRK